MGFLTDIANKLTGKSYNPEPGTALGPLSESSDQPLEERKLVEYVKNKVDSIRQSNSRIALEGIYMTNIAYLLGFDGIYYDSTYRQFKNADPRRKLTRNRMRVNKILPQAQNRLARITQSPPRFDVRPNSNSTEDKDAARLGLDVVIDIFDRQRLQEKRQDLHMAGMQGGVSYLQTTWDPCLGNPMYDPETQEFMGYEGDVRIDVLNCLEVFPDPLAKSLEDAQFWIKAKVRKLDYFRERYPERGSAVKEEDAWLLSSIYDMKSNALTNVGITGASTSDQMKNSAIELVYHEKRSKDHKNGRKIVIANGVLLEDKELPIGEFDLVKFDDIVVGGRYYSEAVITHARPIQDHYNLLRSKCADWVRKMLAGKYLSPKGAGLGQEALNNESGEVLEYNPVPNASPPQALQIPQIPQYVYKELETCDKDLDYVFGINEISRGVLPSASIPAAGMAFLQEQDQTRIGVQTTRNEIGYSRVASHVLKYVGRYYKMPRLLKLAGDGLEYTVKSFVGSDLKDNFDIITVPGSTIPQSKVLRRQDIINAYQMGLLGDPADPQLRSKVLGMVEYGDTSEMWKDQALDEAQVKKVIEIIEQGDEIALMGTLDEFDNHQFHLKKLNEYRKGDKYQALDDAKKKLLKFLMDWHLQALSNIQNPQLAQQQEMAQLNVNNMQQAMASGQMNPSGMGMPTDPAQANAPMNETPMQ